MHERLLAFFGGFKSDAHPMAIMVVSMTHRQETCIACDPVEVQPLQSLSTDLAL